MAFAVSDLFQHSESHRSSKVSSVGDFYVPFKLQINMIILIYFQVLNILLSARYKDLFSNNVESDARRKCWFVNVRKQFWGDAGWDGG